MGVRLVFDSVEETCGGELVCYHNFDNHIFIQIDQTCGQSPSFACLDIDTAELLLRQLDKSIKMAKGE